MRTSTRIGAALTAAAAIAGVASATSAADAVGPQRTTLGGSVPSWARAANYHGAAATTGHVGFRVYLGWQHQSALDALIKSVTTPGSKNYGHYLTPGQFRAQFAPSAADVASVQHWLKGAGFTLDYTPSNNLYVEAEGSVGQAAKAFSTSFGEYKYKGHTLRSPKTALSVPSSLPAIAGVIGLDQSSALVRPATSPKATPPAGYRNARPCSTTWGEKNTATTPVPATPSGPLLGYDASNNLVVARDSSTTLPNYAGKARPYAPCGYVPDQLRAAYGLTSSNTGAGQTVAIIDAYASPTIVQDVNQYYTNHGGSLYPKLTSANFTQVVAPGTFRRPENKRQDPQGWYGEETLDVEAVHATAPQAHIVFVGAPNNYQDLDAALNHVVNQHLATIVTNSYGWAGEALPKGYIKPQEQIFEEAAATGIGVYFSSGDSGDETNGVAGATPTPDWEASSPLVTAVGGTSLEWNGTSRTEYGWETEKATLHTDGSNTDAGLSWNTPFYLYGGGGGISRLFGVPWYQQGALATSGVDSVRNATGRVVPDVAAIADPNTGMLIGETQTFSDGTYYDEYRIGGTSLASPFFAGIMADAQQARGSVIGFANPLLYATHAYDDITPAPAGESDVRVDFANGENASGGLLASVRTIGYEGLTIHTGTGFDDVTGLGSPSDGFVSAVASATPLTR